MARVKIATIDRAAASDGVVALFDGERDPIRCHVHRMSPGTTLRIAGERGDWAGYVWRGDCRALDTSLVTGSSLIVEHGGALEIVAGNMGAVLVGFAANTSDGTQDSAHVHLLPAEKVPRFGDIARGDALSGGLHADAGCPTCSVWLHENGLAAPEGDAPVRTRESGIHSHTEDEVIFVTGGQIRLGQRLYGPGTAIAIAGKTFYGFTTGPEGLSFINFRAALPSAIRFKAGHSVDETGYWRAQVPSPSQAYITA